MKTLMEPSFVYFKRCPIYQWSSKWIAESRTLVTGFANLDCPVSLKVSLCKLSSSHLDVPHSRLLFGSNGAEST